MKKFALAASLLFVATWFLPTAALAKESLIQTVLSLWETNPVLAVLAGIGVVVASGASWYVRRKFRK